MITIRVENEKDYYQAEWMTKKAFWNLHRPGCDEHLLVHKLRGDSAYMKELSRIAEVDGKIVGAIYYAKAHVKYGDDLVDIITFGPLCVDPEYQNKGIGQSLLKETLELAKALGHKGVIIFGEPGYYPKIGFKPCEVFGITTGDGKNFDAFMGLELEPGFFKPGGSFVEAAVYETLTEEEAQSYDQQFPYLAKVVKPGQWDYEEPVLPEVIQVLRQRTSLRQYTDQPIDAYYKKVLFECGMKAPTAGNQMLYSMIDITDQGLKDRLAVLCDDQPFIAKAPMVVIFVADHQKWFDYYTLNDVKGYCEEKSELSFEAPQESDLLLACEDAMCAAQNMVIAAEALGIGSCYIGDILENYEKIQALLHLPDWAFPIGMLVFGYRDLTKERIFRKRFDQKFVIFENQYQTLDEEALKEMFEEEDAKYNPNNPHGAKNYAQQFYRRKTGAAFSKEMARSVRVALKRWDGRML